MAAAFNCICVVFVSVCLMLAAASQPTFIINTKQPFVPKVELEQGVVLGETDVSLHKRTFYSFKGIPYAQPPIGELRFKPPVRIGRSHGQINATKEGPECIQKNYLLPVPAVSGEEDCLYMNIYTPQIDSPGELPVMVYIHGGGWFTGSGTSLFLGPQHLLDQDVVLVTFNYRLGALGFLGTGDDASPGNYGMKDQVQALKWVQENIDAFGGNKNLVTIFGQSAGATSSHYHMLSPLSRGLFQRVISQSGTVMSTWAWPRDPLSIARRQGGFVNCTQESTTELVSCLRGVDARTLVDSGDNFHAWSIDPMTTFTPVLEPKGAGAFLSEDPLKLMQSGEFARVPWMLGVVAQEGIIRGVPIVSDERLLNDLNANWTTLGPQIFEISRSVPSNKVDELWNNITKFYLNDKVPIKPDDALGFIDMYSDRGFVHGTHKSALLHSAKGHDNIFMYHFNYRTSQPVSYQFAFAPTNPHRYGVSHCDDLLYLFNSPALFQGWPSHPADVLVVDTLVRLWTNFAKHGEPTPGARLTPRLSCPLDTGRPCDLDSLKWTPLAVGNGSAVARTSYLDISNSGGALELTMGEGLFQRRMDFWDNAPLAENSVGF